MQQNTQDRRLELLKLEGNGLLKPEVVEQLTQKYGVSKDTVWRDYRTRKYWQPILSEMVENLHKIKNRHEQLYRKASLTYLQSESNSQKISAINLMRQINRDYYEFCYGSGPPPTGDEFDGYILRWENEPETKNPNDKI
jgi:hypothetical protein